MDFLSSRHFIYRRIASRRGPTEGPQGVDRALDAKKNLHRDTREKLQALLETENGRDIERYIGVVLKRKNNAERLKQDRENLSRDTTSIFALQSGMDFVTMSSLFLEFREGLNFTVNLHGNPKFELHLGLGYIIPPSVRKVKVTSQKRERTGIREIRGNKIGYYDEQGYIPVFSGYTVQILETIDEKKSDYAQKFHEEKEFYEDRKRLVQNDEWREETIDDVMASQNPEANRYRGDWILMCKILLPAQIKIDPDTVLLDAAALRSFHGEGFKKLDQPTLELLQKLAANGYEFRIVDLLFLHELAHRPSEKVRPILKALERGERITFQQLFEASGEARAFEVPFGKGELTIHEARNHPRYRRRVAENNLPFKTPDDYLSGYYRNRPSAKIDPSKINLDIYPDGTLLGRLQCARFVCDVLGLDRNDYRSGFTQSAGALFATLIQSGGGMIADPENLQAGDILFMRGTSRNLWNMISHAAVVIGRDTNHGRQRLIVRHHGRFVKTTSYFLDDSLFDKKFYAGIRHRVASAQIQKIMRTSYA